MKSDCHQMSSNKICNSKFVIIEQWQHILNEDRSDICSRQRLRNHQGWFATTSATSATCSVVWKLLLFRISIDSSSKQKSYGIRIFNEAHLPFFCRTASQSTLFLSHYCINDSTRTLSSTTTNRCAFKSQRTLHFIFYFETLTSCLHLQQKEGSEVKIGFRSTTRLRSTASRFFLPHIKDSITNQWTTKKVFTLIFRLVQQTIASFYWFPSKKLWSETLFKF